MFKEDDIRNREIFNKYIELVKEDILNHFADHDGFDTINCPACESGSHSYEFIKEGFNYVTCNRCSTLYVNPRPTLKKIVDFYADSVSSKYWTNYFFKPVAEVRRELIFKPRAEYISSIIKGRSIDVVGDIGAGFGIFLEELSKLIAIDKLVAIEPSIEQAQLCQDKGFVTLNCALEEVSGYKESFDLLTVFELFEHLVDPLRFLKKVFTLLKPGALLYLSTLNGQGFDIQVLWSRSKSIMPPCHLNFLNPESLKLLLSRCGFTILNISTPGMLDLDIVEGMYKNEGVQVDRFFKLLFDKDDQNCRVEFQKWIINNKLSSHMTILACK